MWLIQKFSHENREFFHNKFPLKERSVGEQQLEGCAANTKMKEKTENKNKTCEGHQSESKSNKTKTKLLSMEPFVFSASSSPLHLLSLPEFFLSPPPSLSLSKQSAKNKIKFHIISPGWLEDPSPPVSDEPRDGHCRPCARSGLSLSSFFLRSCAV